MKKIIKLIPILLLVLALGCESDDSDNRFSSDPTSGWVEFSTTAPGETITIITEELLVPVSIRVPIFEDGITVNYSIEAVEGDFNSILTTGSSVFLPATVAGSNGSPFIVNIPLSFSGVSDLEEVVVFDVVLVSTSINGIDLGLDDNSITRYRISTPCPIDLETFVGTYTVEEMFTGPPNAPNGLSFFFGETYQLELSVNPDDVTETQMIMSNSIGFSPYIGEGTVMTFDTCNFSVSFDPEAPILRPGTGDYPFAVISSSYDDVAKIIQVNGTAGNFGDYQFILTKQ